MGCGRPGTAWERGGGAVHDMMRLKLSFMVSNFKLSRPAGSESHQHSDSAKKETNKNSIKFFLVL